jgi:septal ring factor EnvC (AmiA/AmiB activator)
MKAARVLRNPLLIVVATLLMASPAISADKPGKETRRLQQQLRAAEQEKSQLAQQKSELETQLKAAQDKASDAVSRADSAESRNARLNKELKATKAELVALTASSKAEQATLSAKLGETEHKMAEQRQVFDNEKHQMDDASTPLRTALSGCQERNGRMYVLGNELLDKYEKKSCFTSALQAEPFTGLKRAQIENMIEEDREKFDKDQLLPAPTPAAPLPSP